MFDNVETDSFIDLGQRSQVEILAKQQNQCDTLLRLNRLDQVAQFRRMEAGDMLAKVNDIAIRDCGADMHQEIGAYRAVFSVDVRVAVDSDFVGTAVVVAGAAHGPLQRLPPTEPAPERLLCPASAKLRLSPQSRRDRRSASEHLSKLLQKHRK